MALDGGTSRQFTRTLMRAELLDAETERALAIAWRDHRDEAALHRLVTAYMRLAISMASKYRKYGAPVNDLIQEAGLGLMKAAEKFDPDRGVRFSTYAMWWVKASIQDFVMRNWSMVRTGSTGSQKALFFNLRRLRAKLSGGPDRRPDAEIHAEIAEAVGVSQADVALMDSRLSGHDASLNAPVAETDSGNTSERQDFLVSDDPLPDETVGRAIDEERRKRWIDSALKVLSDRELRIVRERRLSEETVTLEALGKNLGISKERVRQIENRALEKLRAALLQELPDGDTAMI